MVRAISTVKAMTTHAETVFLYQYIVPYGKRNHLMTDNDPKFVSGLLSILRRFPEQKHLTTAAHRLRLMRKIKGTGKQQ